MKFAHKLSLSLIVLLAVLLAAVGYLTVRSNFQVSLATGARQNYTQHLLERYSLESDLATFSREYEQADEAYLREYGETLTGYIGGDTRWLCILSESGSIIYSNMPAEVRTLIGDEVLDPDAEGYFIRRIEGQDEEAAWVMLVASAVQNGDENLWLVSGYDITGVFAERDRQLRDTIRMDAVLLAIAAVLVVLLCVQLTRPIRKLNLTARKIASGAYNARSGVKTKDEIGELSRNFNRMATAVEDKIEDLNLSVRQREDFVSAFTHEIKTPMTAIIGYSDILRFQDVDAQRRQRAAHFIYRESKRLEALSQKLLQLMGLSSEPVELLPVSLHALFGDAARSVFADLNEVQLKIQNAEGMDVLADHDLIVDLLRNLLLNAIRAMDGAGTILIRWQAEGAHCRISVRDEGRGIPEEELQRITEPFYMVDKSRARKQGSSGVGLALCQKIAEAHGTALAFESEVGVGTTVSIELELA